MDKVPFTAYQDTTVRPGYQDTMVISAVLPTEGLVLMEPEREKRPPLLAMPYAIGNMTSRYKNADLKKDTLMSKRRHMRVGRYLVYNTGEDPIFIKKGETLGHCTLIYQDSMDDYLNEMSHMANEARADKVEWKNHKTQYRERDTTKPTGVQPLSEDWVKDVFRLSDNEVLKDKPELMGQLVKVLANHGPAFEGGPHRAKETGQQGAGRTHWITARVELKDDTTGPAHVKQRCMHPHDEDLLSSQLALWIKQGVIEPCKSQWNSALLAVSKKDSILKCFCIDLRPLNKQCKKLSVFQGSIDTNLDRLHGSVLYSAFDMSSGFMAVTLEDSSKQYFAFTTPKQGTYAFSVLPFGCFNSPAFYPRFINRLVSTMPVGSTLAYIDDILLHSKEASGIHMVQLIDQFLSQVEQSGAKIQVTKTALMKSQVNYLGFIVGKAGITMNRQYRSALLDFPPPTSGKGLARFLGMVGFYRQFLPGLAAISARLHTKKHENPWTPMSEEDLPDFYKIKEKLFNSEALASPDFSDLDKYPLIMGLDFLDPSNVCNNLTNPEMLGRIIPKKTAVLFREEVFTIRTKLVFTPWRIGHVRLGIDNICMVVKEGTILGRDRLNECELHQQYEDFKGSPREVGQAHRFILLYHLTRPRDCGRLCVQMSQSSPRTNARRTGHGKGLGS